MTYRYGSGSGAGADPNNGLRWYVASDWLVGILSGELGYNND